MPSSREGDDRSASPPRSLVSYITILDSDSDSELPKISKIANITPSRARPAADNPSSSSRVSFGTRAPSGGRAQAPLRTPATSTFQSPSGCRVSATAAAEEPFNTSESRLSLSSPRGGPTVVSPRDRNLQMLADAGLPVPPGFHGVSTRTRRTSSGNAARPTASSPARPSAAGRGGAVTSSSRAAPTNAMNPIELSDDSSASEDVEEYTAFEREGLEIAETSENIARTIRNSVRFSQEARKEARRSGR